jgi:uncharacterized delta-60 repeat protein
MILIPGPNREWILKLSGLGLLLLSLTLSANPSPAGALDASFHPPVFWGDVRCILLQPDGKILVGGAFTVNGPQEYRNIIRLNPDGSVDDGFHPFAGMEGTNHVSTMVLQSDGKVLVGGSLATAGGIFSGNLARLNTDGERDPSFQPVVALKSIAALAVLPDGTIIVGGTFAGAVARLQRDGKVDPAFKPSLYLYISLVTPGAPSVNALAIQPDGQILAGGIMGNFAAPTEQGVIRLHSNGSRDQTFIPSVGSANGALTGSRSVSVVQTLLLQPDNRILVTGLLNRTAFAVPQFGMARLHPDGSTDFSFDRLKFQGIRSLALPRENRILIGGSFTDAGMANIAHLNSAGFVDPLFQARTDASVQALAIQPDGRILLGGMFTNVNGTRSPGLARLNGDDLTPRPPRIVLESTNRTVLPGTNVIFSVLADGFPLQYQWRLNGTNLPGATNETYSLTNVQPTHNGTYSVLVSNSMGAATSVSERLIVLDLADALDGPGLAWKSGGTFVGAGWYGQVNTTHDGFDAVENAVPVGVAPNLESWLETSVTGPGVLDFWWKTSSSNSNVRVSVNGAARATITGDRDWEWQSIAVPAGKQTIRWSNLRMVDAYSAKNRAWIDEVHFTAVTGPPSFLNQPQSQTVSIGGDAALTAKGSAVLGYQWFFEGQPIGGATQPTLALTNVTPERVGNYSVLITNSAGSVSSAAAKISALNPPASAAMVSTIAGSGAAGYKDGDGREAQFNAPNDPAIGPDGFIYVADTFNHRIRRVSPTGKVSTWAGNGIGIGGYSDGSATNAQFHYPIGVWATPSGDLFVADAGNNRIRKISALEPRSVSTVAGSGEQGYTDGPGAMARFDFPNDLVMDASGNIFVSEFNNHTIRKITPGGEVTTFAGNGMAGYADGLGKNALLSKPAGLAIDSIGNLYLSEWGNQRIRRITPDGTVTTLAGNGETGFADGTGLNSKFNEPDDLTVDAAGNLFVIEHNHAVRRIDGNGEVSTIAGTGQPGYLDGRALEAKFFSPSGIAVDAGGSVIVVDTGNHVIRKVTFSSLPQIVEQPQSQTVTAGGTAKLKVAASGEGPFTYQWRRNGVNLAGATNADLVLTNLQMADTGSYSAQVANRAGTVASDLASLTIPAPLPPLPGALDASFHPPNLRGDVRCILLQPEGRILVGGAFTVEGPSMVRGIARLNPDGTLDSAFNMGQGTEGTNSYVSAMAQQTDDKVLLAGLFTGIAGVTRGNIARLNSDNSIDPSFQPNLGPINYLASLAVLPDGKIMVGGSFPGGIVRLHSDGRIDTDFKSSLFVYLGIFSQNTPIVEAIIPQADRHLLVGGFFMQPIQQGKDGVALLNENGIVNPAFKSGIGGIGSISTGESIPYVTSMLVDRQNRAIVAGHLNPSGQHLHSPRYRLARLSTNGSTDLSFERLPSQDIQALALQSDEKILIGGQFTNISGILRTNIARVHSSGRIDPTFHAPAIDGRIQALAIQPDGRVLVGGAFTNAGGLLRPGIVRLNADNLTPRPPVMIRQPVGGMAGEGSEAVLYVLADGSDLKYQWQFNESNVPGATNEALFLPKMTAADVGQYSVMVSNQMGVVASTKASLAMIDLTTALNQAGLTWKTGGTVGGWTVQTNVTHDGFAAAKSATLTGLQGIEESWIETTVIGPGMLEFSYRSLSGGQGSGLYLTGSPGFFNAREWERQTVSIPSGPQTVRWSYRALQYALPADIGAWLDEVRFTPSGTPRFHSVQFVSNSLQLAVVTLPGTKYIVQTSNDLVRWSARTNVIATAFTTTLTEALSADSPQLFYRVIEARD